jgi:hypothetical protein
MIRLILGLIVVLSAALPAASAVGGAGTCMTTCAVKRSAADTGCRFKSSDQMGKCIEDNRKAYDECKAACAKQYGVGTSTETPSGSTEPAHTSTAPEPSPSNGQGENQPPQPRR